MKRNYLHIFALSVAMLVCGGQFTSCSDDKDDIVVEVTGFELLPESKDLPFSYENESQTVSFTAKGNWKVELENGDYLVYFALSSGKKCKTALKVTVARNTSSSARTTTFHPVSGSESVPFTVRQPEFEGTLPDIG